MEPTWFTAVLNDSQGSLTGETNENSSGEKLSASLSGHRSGGSVSFVKFYHIQNELYDEVIYKGSVSDNGDRISGEWTIPSDASGLFSMTRDRLDKRSLEMENIREI